MSTLFADRIHTAKQLNRTSGKILAEAREHAVTVVTEGQAAVVMQSRVAAARQAHAEALLKRLAPLFLLERDSRLPDDLRWVKDLHPKNFAQFRLALPGPSPHVQGACRTVRRERPAPIDRRAEATGLVSGRGVSELRERRKLRAA